MLHEFLYTLILELLNRYLQGMIPVHVHHRMPLEYLQVIVQFIRIPLIGQIVHVRCLEWQKHSIPVLLVPPSNIGEILLTLMFYL